FLFMHPPTPRSTLFPYTTLFRSRDQIAEGRPRAPGILRCRNAPAFDQKSLQANYKNGDENQRRLIRINEFLRSLEVAARCGHGEDRKSTRLNSSHVEISYAVFCL